MSCIHNEGDLAHRTRGKAIILFPNRYVDRKANTLVYIFCLLKLKKSINSPISVQISANCFFMSESSRKYRFLIIMIWSNK